VSGLFVAGNFPDSAPGPAHIGWMDFVSSVAQELSLAAMVLFAINYPDDRPVGWRAVLKRWYPWYFGVVAAVTLYYYAQLYRGNFEPLAGAVFRIDAIALPAIFLVTIVLAWREARGDARIRMQWILASLGTIVAAVLLGNLNATAGFPMPPELAAVILNASILVGIVVFVYAVMRHRIFDFGLAVNRTLVFAIVGAILLAAFQAANRFVTVFLHFDDGSRRSADRDPRGRRLPVVQSLKKIVERFVDRLLFSRWAEREDDLRRFIAEAKHVRDPDALSTLTVAALDRFTDGAGAALYRRDDQGSHRRLHATLADAPEAFGPDDAVVLAMQAHRNACRPRERAPASPADLAVPMTRRRTSKASSCSGRGATASTAPMWSSGQAAMHEIGLGFHTYVSTGSRQKIAGCRGRHVRAARDSNGIVATKLTPFHPGVSVMDQRPPTRRGSDPAVAPVLSRRCALHGCSCAGGGSF
jgi:hypothetical protein